VSTAAALQRRGSGAWPLARLAALARGRAAPAAIFGLAAALRLVALGRTQVDPFYDAAVRSMGLSWHNLLLGAYDPSAHVAIDKPPVDLWLQVASTRVFGFSTFALLLPAALGGTLAVVALYDLLRTLLGREVALAGALALAVLPIAVVTARSDTMDSVMAAFVVAALAVAARGLRDARTSRIVAAGALLGLAFEVKLFEALVAAPVLALLWWLGARATRRRRALGLGGAAAAFVAVGVAWLVAVTAFVPAAQRPFAFGSTNGSAWSSVFVYDGWDRIAGTPKPPLSPAAASGSQAAHLASLGRAPAAAGPLRLVDDQAHVGSRLGIELVVAWVAVLVALAAGAWRGEGRAGRAGLAALAAWLALGTVLFSVQGALRPRYLEAFDPAVAACLGAGVVLAGRRLRASGAVIAASVGVLLAAPLALSVSAVAGHAQDSGSPGAIPAARVTVLSGYLRAHQAGARYEAASVAVAKAGPLIARDGRPVLLLTSTYGRPLVSVSALARLAAAGQVRYALVGDSCTPTSPDPWTGCSPAARWIRAHGIDVSRAAGQPHRGLVYEISAASRPRTR